MAVAELEVRLQQVVGEAEAQRILPKLLAVPRTSVSAATHTFLMENFFRFKVWLSVACYLMNLSHPQPPQQNTKEGVAVLDLQK